MTTKTITPILQADSDLTDDEITGINAEIKHNAGQVQAYDDHDCPKQNFLDDPITIAASEFIGSIHCYWCELEQSST
jgi:hypothetical protein